MDKYKTIGIIGGQGPISTADFYLRIIKYFQNNFGAHYIRDYPPMIIYSVPTPDLVKSIEDDRATFSKIADATKKLENDGADFIIIACNSLQYLIDGLQNLVKIPIIRIAPIVTKYLRKKGYKNVGILATNTVIKQNVYGKHLKSDAGLIIPSKADQKTIEKVILNIIGGVISRTDKQKIKKVILDLEKNGAETVLLACTELPLIIGQKDVKIPLVDCNELYIQEAAKRSHKII